MSFVYKTKRRVRHTTRRNRKKQGKRNTHRNGGKINFGIRDTLNRWYNKTVRSSASPPNSLDEHILQVETKRDPKIISDTELDTYVKMFMACYKKEFFFNRPLKKGRCKTLSDNYSEIFYITQTIKTKLIDEIEKEIGALVPKDPTILEKKIVKKTIAGFAKDITKKAIAYFQVKTGKEKIAADSANKDTSDLTESSYIENNDTRYYQRLLKGNWRWYRNALSRGAINYLTNNDITNLETYAMERIRRETPEGKRVTEQTRLSSQIAPGTVPFNSTSRIFRHSDQSLSSSSQPSPLWWSTQNGPVPPHHHHNRTSKK